MEGGRHTKKGDTVVFQRGGLIDCNVYCLCYMCVRDELRGQTHLKVNKSYSELRDDT